MARARRPGDPEMDHSVDADTMGQSDGPERQIGAPTGLATVLACVFLVATVVGFPFGIAILGAFVWLLVTDGGVPMARGLGLVALRVASLALILVVMTSSAGVFLYRSGRHCRRLGLCLLLLALGVAVTAITAGATLEGLST